jgi:PAS domain S-box-containing protein
MITMSLSEDLARIVVRLSALEPPSEGRRPGGRGELASAVQSALADDDPPTLVSDDQGRYVAASLAACELTGYALGQLRGRFVWDLTHGARRSEFEPLWRAFLLQGRQHGEYLLEGRDGRRIKVSYAAQAHVLRGFHVSVLAPDHLSPSGHAAVTGQTC